MPRHGVGATSGWPGSDWIEDILLQRSGPAVYEQWATGELPWRSPEVREAWKTWGRLIAPGGSDAQAAAALANDFQGNDGKGLLTADGQGCAREHQGSFVRRLYGKDIAFVPTTEAVPELANDRNAYEVAGDMAALFRDTEGSRSLITFLTGDTARATWARAVPERNRPFFPVSVGAYGDAWANRPSTRP